MTDNSTITLVWSIEDFCLFYPWHTDLFITSPFFFVHGGKSFAFVLFPGGRGKSSNRVDLTLKINFPKTETVTIYYELSFLTTGDTPYVSERISETVRGITEVTMENCPTQEEIFVTKSSTLLPEGALKVQCRIWTPGEAIVEPKVHHKCGRVLRNLITTMFSIQDFSKLRVGETRSVYSNSPLFPVNKVIHTLKLSGSKQRLEEAVVDLEVFLDESIINKKCQLTLLNKFGESVIAQIRREISTQQGFCFKFEKFITRQEIIDRKEEFLPGDVLSLLCEFSRMDCSQRYSTETLLNKTIANFVPKTSKSKRAFSAFIQSSSTEATSLNLLPYHLLSLYKEQNFSDFELRTEGISFPVHKNILAARSPVFKALLSSNMGEVTSGFQDIPDVDKDTLDRMLFFIYSDIVEDLQWDEAAKLYYAADKYQILSLRQKCSSYLQANVDDSNVYEILEIANRHDDQGLISVVEEFFLGRAREIMNSTEWRIFRSRNPHLAAEIASNMISRLTVNISK